LISIDALLFDLDGTLIDSKRDLARSVQFLQESYGAPVSSENRVGTFVGDGVVKLVQRALPSLKPGDLQEAVSQFKQYYRRHCVDHTRVYPGVIRALRHFGQKKMAVVTNKPVKVSGYILDQLGLGRYFQVLIGGDSLPNKKPHPEPVLSALATLGIANSRRVVMVGDGPNDIQSGRAAGTYTCWIRSNIGNGHKNVSTFRPDFSISTMTELMRIFN
jgi:phosphoglycolate phosphatase